METTAVQSAKLAIVAATGLSKDALHIYIGLSIFFAVAAATKRAVSSWLPWLTVLFVAATGEIVDMRDDLLSLGYWRWTASLHDVINTIFWPTAFLVFARATSLFARTGSDSPYEGCVKLPQNRGGHGSSAETDTQPAGGGRDQH